MRPGDAGRRRVSEGWLEQPRVVVLERGRRRDVVSARDVYPSLHVSRVAGAPRRKFPSLECPESELAGIISKRMIKQVKAKR